MTDLPPLRYLSTADVIAAMPSLSERLELAATTLRGLAGPAELPPKVAIHPRPEGSFAHTMPAYLPDPSGNPKGDWLGMKWILGFPANVANGLPNIHGLLLLNDPVTGVPTAILDAGPITAERTAAVSGVAIRAFAPDRGNSPTAAVIGAGVQGRSHLVVLGHLLPGVGLAVFDRDPLRAAALAEAAAATPGIGAVHIAASPRDAVEGAGVVITAASFAPPSERQVMTNAWLAPDALVVPVDYATFCAAEVAREASLFAVDHTGQFLANRDAGNFDGYPEPMAMLGQVIDGLRPDGRIVTTHLGTGLADVVFGTAIVAAAEARGLGLVLPR